VSKKSKSKRKERRTAAASNKANVMAKATVSTVGLPVNVVAVKAQPKDHFNPDYGNVVKDLKRIAGLAGLFIAVLIILSFFLR
jgi:hypothetical protein